jgi:hypothetical protein
MSISSEITNERVALLMEVAQPLQPGDVITHEVCEEVLGCPRHVQYYDHCTNLFRRRLLRERGIGTWFERTVGYKLLTNEENLTFVQIERSRKAIRQHRRALETATFTRVAKTSVHLRRRQQFVIDQAREKIEAERVRLADLLAPIRPTPPNPHRPRPAIEAVAL